MVSVSVKSLFCIVAALTFSNNVLCKPLRVIAELHTNLNGNFSTGPRISNARHSSATEDDTNRIVGGKYAWPNQFPFMAVVHRLMGGGLVAQCGGTIISPRWVLTAGHCVSTGPHLFLLVFGTNDKYGIGYNFYQGSGVAMMSNKGVLHPDYSPSVNDVGLIYTPRNIPYADSIQPIQLAGQSEYGETFANSVASVIGWGKDGNSGAGTMQLKYATLPVISNYECSQFWDVTNKHVCTASGYGQDACQGDSGGPLVVAENGYYLQIGIVSYGDANCPSDKPGVFTRVTGYIQWIERVSALYA